MLHVKSQCLKISCHCMVLFFILILIGLLFLKYELHNSVQIF
jgi:hypothetical protein